MPGARTCRDGWPRLPAATAHRLVSTPYLVVRGCPENAADVPRPVICPADDSAGDPAIFLAIPGGILVAVTVVMELHAADRPSSSLLPVLYVGAELPGAVLRELRAAGIGLLQFATATPALRLLKHCRVAGVLCHAPGLEDVDELRRQQVPVILFALGSGDWEAEGVTVVDFRSDPATVAALVRHALLERSFWVAA